MSEDTPKNEISRILIANIGEYHFGAPIDSIHDVIQRQKKTSVPLTQSSIVGLLNLRGHIVTEIDMSTFLDVKTNKSEESSSGYSVVINHNGELYSLAFDSIGDVIDVPLFSIERLPETIDRRWVQVSKGVYRHSDDLLIILDLSTIIDQLIGNAQLAV